MMSNDIPIEGVLKYIKRERDKLKDKLEILTKYTKSLEERFAKARDIIEEKQREIDSLREDAKLMRHDIKQSEMWKTQKNQMRIMTLRARENSITIERLILENKVLKNKLKEYGDTEID